MKLFRDYGILASNLVELGALACQVDGKFASMFNRPIVSLAKVVSYCLHKTLDKGPVRTSDWSKDLTRAQMKCTYGQRSNERRGPSHGTVDASNDVHSGLVVYKSLMKTARSSRTWLLPERYTSDLGKELKGKGGGGVTSRTKHDVSVQPSSRDGGGPHYQLAYTLWRQGRGLLDICIRMGDQNKPQSETVVMWVSFSTSSQGAFAEMGSSQLVYSTYIDRGPGASIFRRGTAFPRKTG
jgi:hypothetical protein